jgi:lysophospholipase L1-like esterase
MANPKTFSKQTIVSSSDEDVLQIKNSTGNVVSWIDADGVPQGGMAPGTTVTLQTGGIDNGSQSILNLSAGSNISLTDVGNGTVSIASTAGAAPIVTQNGLIGEYHFDTGSGTSLVDVSGAANNGTFGAGGNAPTWNASPLLGLKFSGGQFVTLPSALNSGVTFMAYTSFDQASGSPSAPAIIHGVSGTNNLSLDYSIVSASNPSYYTMQSSSTGQNCVTSLSPMGNQVVAFVLRGGGLFDLHYIDGKVNQGYSASGGSLNGQSGGNLQVGGTTSFYFVGTIHFLAIWNRALTDAEIAQNTQNIASFVAKRNVPYQAAPGLTMPFPSGFSSYASAVSTDTIVPIGDSNMSGLGSGGNTIATYWTLNGTWLTAFVGSSSGATFSKNIVDFSQHVQNIYPGNASRTAAIVWMGGDDFLAGATVQQVFNMHKQYHQMLRARGYKTIAATQTDATTFDTPKNQFNALVRKYWTTYADSLADVAAVPQIGADGSSTNTTYFADGIHLTATGMQLASAVFQNAVNSLFGNTVTSDAVNIATGTYAQVDADVFLKANPSGGNVTINLLSAQKWCGRSCSVYNIQTAGANTVTLAANGSETIMGASTYAVPNNTIIKLQAVLVSPSTGGANWIIVP